MKKKCKLLIPEDPFNKGKEQYKVFQLNGETVQVPIGMYVDVPEWVAKKAKEIGLVADYIDLDA